MNKELRSKEVDRFFDAILTLQTREECYAFFQDVCTVNEIQSLSQRFEVARLLQEQCTYQTIAGKTGASTATISRVNRSLQFGGEGYGIVFGRLGLPFQK